MAEPLRLMVWTPSATLIDAENVEWVHITLIGDQGLTIWPGHAPLLGETDVDAVGYADQAGTHTIDLPSGIVQVENNTVTLFLVGTLDEQAWPREGDGERFERLAETMLGALERDARSEDRFPGREQA